MFNKKKGKKDSLSPFLDSTDTPIPAIEFDDLPDEIIEKVFSSLDFVSLCKICCVCKRFQRIGDENSLWEQIISNYFHDAAKSAPYAEHFKTNPTILSAVNFELESDDSIEYKKMFKDDFILGPLNERQSRLKRLKEVFIITIFHNHKANFTTPWNESWYVKYYLLERGLIGNIFMELVKCTFLGDRSVGKTSLIMEAVNNNFSGNYIPDEIEEYYSANLIYNHTTFTIQICDTPGDIKYFHGARKSCLQDVDLFAICVNIVELNSIESAQFVWAPMVRMMCLDVPVILITCDDAVDAGTLTEDQLTTREQMVQNIIVKNPDKLQISQIAKEIGAGELECSALTSEGVHEMFDEFLRWLFLAEGKVELNPKKNDKSSNCTLQ